MAAKRTDHVPLCILTSDHRGSRRGRETLSATGALSGYDIPFAVSNVAQGAIHLETRNAATSVRSTEGKRSSIRRDGVARDIAVMPSDVGGSNPRELACRFRQFWQFRVERIVCRWNRPRNMAGKVSWP